MRPVCPSARLGLGLAALGRPGYINLGHAADVGDTAVEAMERHAHDGARRGLRGRRALLRRGALLRARRGLPGLVARTPRPLARRRHGRLEVGLHLHRRLACRRRRARGQGPLGEHAAPPARRDARAPRRAPRALPDPLGHARERRPRRPGGARGARAAARGGRPRRLHRHGPAPGGDDRARPRGRRLRRRAGDLEPARALGHRRARRRARGRARRDRQGGPGQRAADGARRRRGPAARRRARARDDARTRWRSRPSSPSRGSTSSSAARRRSTPCAATWRALDAEWDARAEEALAPLEEPAEEYWERRSELAWN